MSNIFKQTRDFSEPIKRNSYDLSFTNHLTCKFGYLYPVFCKEVTPGDSFSIQPSFGLRALPMVFPVQSPIRAHLHFFYVRNRTLWDKWQDWIGATADNTVVHPYIVQSTSFFKTKSLADFLGVPTSLVEGSLYNNEVLLDTNYSVETYSVPTQLFTPSVRPTTIDARVIKGSKPFHSEENVPYSKPVTFYKEPAIEYYAPYQGFLPLGNYMNYGNSLATKYEGYITKPIPKSELVEFCSDEDNTIYFMDLINSNPVNGSLNVVISRDQTDGNASHSVPIYIGAVQVIAADSYAYVDSSSLSTLKENVLQLVDSHTFVNKYRFTFYSSVGSQPCGLWNNESLNADTITNQAFTSIGRRITLRVKSYKSIDTSELDSLPWSGSNPSIRLNALPFRAYEAIYNSYYRNYMNNPFILNGKPQYNRYVTNLNSGPDTTPYKLEKRNWELDWLTSAQQSPQQGEAPLVGLTVNNVDSTATLKFFSQELADAGVNNGEVTADLKIDADSNVLGISYYDKDLPQSNLSRLMEAITYGISINDLRQTNSLQRWLEKNIRNGFRYIDQMKSHFNVKLSFNELLMPEFIGGVSENVNTNTITQTTPTAESPLGSFGGQASAIGTSKNRIHKYCDEAGFIIGILSIAPTPVYSQIPANYLYRSERLEYFFPEFGKIGMQPIFKKEITPLQLVSIQEGEEVFGYQRAWSHLISSFDEVHGEFRTDKQGYLVQRLFAETPKLNGDFLTIDNDAINNVFYVDDDAADQFEGMISFEVSKKTAVPLFGIPAIE